MAEVITVTALNRYVKTLLDHNDLLYDVALRGEIANFVQNAKSGHCYFFLRDGQCSVKAVMFRSDARQLASAPGRDAGGGPLRVTLYERDGAFQVYVNAMFRTVWRGPAGPGTAQGQIAAEGLFAPEHKKPLPAFPQRIGLVTSRTGAALQDIKNVIGRRWPAVRLLLCPVNVQGLKRQGRSRRPLPGWTKRVDEIIVARGGGSREDLWVFNAEAIARAAYRCKTPLISAIGHEIDYTILDFVADQRAPTPSAAAELAVPDRQVLRQGCTNWKKICIEICKNAGIYAIILAKPMRMPWPETCRGKNCAGAESSFRPSAERCRRAAGRAGAKKTAGSATPQPWQPRSALIRCWRGVMPWWPGQTARSVRRTSWPRAIPSGWWRRTAARSAW